MNDRHLTPTEVEAFAAELAAAEKAKPGSLPLTPYDDAAIQRLLAAMRAEEATPRRPWWRRWLLWGPL